MINLHMNPAVTSGVFGRCAGRTIVGDNSGIIDVEGKIVECWPAVRSASVSRVIASRRVLKDGARSFDTVNLNKDSLLFPEIIGDGTGGIWGNAPLWRWTRGRPSVSATPATRLGDGGPEWGGIESR